MRLRKNTLHSTEGINLLFANQCRPSSSEESRSALTGHLVASFPINRGQYFVSLRQSASEKVKHLVVPPLGFVWCMSFEIKGTVWILNVNKRVFTFTASKTASSWILIKSDECHKTQRLHK